MKPPFVGQTSYFCVVPSPVGKLLLFGNEKGLQGLQFQDGMNPIEPQEEWQEKCGPFKEVIRQLENYFSGKLHTFRIPLALQGTPFQRSVWNALRQIPYGETTSYGAIARRIGNPKASRAVGAANGNNPVSIIVPCHRVIGANGALVGFGGGLSIKEMLLDLERKFS